MRRAGEGNWQAPGSTANLWLSEPPFNVRSETAENNAGYILATQWLRAELRLWSDGSAHPGKGLSEAYPPVLPDTWKSLTLKNVLNSADGHYESP